MGLAYTERFNQVFEQHPGVWVFIGDRSVGFIVKDEDRVYRAHTSADVPCRDETLDTIGEARGWLSDQDAAMEDT